MDIGNEKIAVVIFLHFDETAHCPEIIPEVKVSGWPDSADNYLFGHDFSILKRLAKIHELFSNTKKWGKRIIVLNPSAKADGKEYCF
jgi:hypothetical protein